MSTATSELNDRKRRIIFALGVGLYFFCSMNKVLVPGSFYNEIQNALSLNANEMAALGAGFMCSYAASQFLLGIFSDCFGGVRLLLTGGLLFLSGAVLSAAAPVFSLMLTARILVGFGAGTSYIGVVKLMTELFHGSLLWIFTTVLVIGFLGPVCGSFPMVRLAQSSSWRTALGVSALAACFCVPLILCFIKGSMKPMRRANALHDACAFWKRRSNLVLIAATSVLSGTHYTICAMIGKKCLEDTGVFSAAAAAMNISVMMLTVALGNVLGNLLFKYLKYRKRLMLTVSSLLSLLGIGCAASFFLGCRCAILLQSSLLLIALPAGFFPVYCIFIKEENSVENAGLSLSMLNFSCFVAIAVEQQCAGLILKCFDVSAAKGIYPPAAYLSVFAALGVFGLISLAAALLFTPGKPEGQTRQ